MSDSNRRSFLIVAGATVAGAAAVATATRAGDPADAVAEASAADAADAADGEIVAHVHDVRAGTISLMVEGRQVSVTDPALAARIATAMGRSAT